MAAARTAALLLPLSLLLTACAGGPAAPEPPPAAAAPAQPAPPPPLQTPAPSPGAVVPKRIAFASGDPLSAPGVYFLDTSTGAGEGWVLPDESQPWVALVSEENRFVAGKAGETGFLIDRRDGTVHQWDPKQVRPRLMTEQGVLLAEVRVDPQTSLALETGRFTWAGPDLTPKLEFSLTAGFDSSTALLSPDGRQVAIHRRSRPEHEIVLVDLTTGRTERLDAPTAPYVATAGLKRHGDGFLVELLASESEPSRGIPDWHQVVGRYDWEGKVLQELRIPGSYTFLSPDGRWVAWEEHPAGDLAPVTVVADAASLEPRLQVLGATTCFDTSGGGGTRWLADSSGLVLNTSEGYRLLRLDGALQEPPAFRGQTWTGEPQPAPDHPDRFALGRVAVSNGAATESLSIQLEGWVTPGMLDPWGATSQEMRLILPPPAKGGACREYPWMVTRVRTPAAPLPAYPLVVGTPGTCLTLRDRGHSSGAELGCLPDGTPLAAVRPRSDTPSASWNDGTWWLSITTEQGQTGWVPLEGAVTWAP